MSSRVTANNPYKYSPTFGAQKSAKRFCRHKANPGFAGSVACAGPEVASIPTLRLRNHFCFVAAKITVR
jgi:hypothetical protein